MNAHSKPATDLQTFHFEGHDLRVEDRAGNLWFFATDACDCLELSNPSKALSALDDDEKGLISSYTLGGTQGQLVISEGGLYTLVLRSRKATTPGTVQHRFRKWVTGEVIPSIRKTGSYSNPSVTVTELDSSTRNAIGGMIKRNTGVVLREAIAPLVQELADTKQRLEEIENRISSSSTCTASDLWRHYGFVPIKGGTLWLGNRLAEMGCVPEFGGRELVGCQWRRKFDATRAHLAMKNGLKLLTDRYIAERHGQGKFNV